MIGPAPVDQVVEELPGSEDDEDQDPGQVGMGLDLGARRNVERIGISGSLRTSGRIGGWRGGIGRIGRGARSAGVERPARDHEHPHAHDGQAREHVGRQCERSGRRCDQCVGGASSDQQHGGRGTHGGYPGAVGVG